MLDRYWGSCKRGIEMILAQRVLLCRSLMASSLGLGFSDCHLLIVYGETELSPDKALLLHPDRSSLFELRRSLSGQPAEWGRSLQRFQPLFDPSRRNSRNRVLDGYDRGGGS